MRVGEQVETDCCGSSNYYTADSALISMRAQKVVYTIFLLLLSAYLTAGAGAYYYSVDSINGADNSACSTGSIGPLAPPCKSISYALNSIPRTADIATINVTAGIYNGSSNVNLTVQANVVYIAGSDSNNRAVIDCLGIGFGFSVKATSTFSLSNIEMRNCVNNGGGAISFKTNGKLVSITNCVFTDNSASLVGGAILGTDSSSVQILRSEFHNNKATQNGGAIALQNTQFLLVQDTLLSGNYAGQAGGGVYMLNQGIFRAYSVDFTNNFAQLSGGAIFSETPNVTSPDTNPTFITISNTTVLNNNCVSPGFNDSYTAQYVCTGLCDADHAYNTSGCPLYQPHKTPKTNNNAIAGGIVAAFVALAAISGGVYFYFRREHNAEMKRREEYRGMIVRALSFMGPLPDEDYPAIDPDTELCALCMLRPITAPLSCGDRVVCSVCRTILLECPVCKTALKDRSATSTQQPSNDRCRVCYSKPATVALPCGDKVVCPSCRLIILECPLCKTSTRERTQTV